MYTDSQRLDWIARHLRNQKWADVLPLVRPVSGEGEYTEKYIDPETFRDAVDSAMSLDAANGIAPRVAKG